MPISTFFVRSGLFLRASRRAFSNTPLNLPLLRKLTEASVKETEQTLKIPLSVLLHYGFELLDRWPIEPFRHYPALGYPDTLSRPEAERVAQVFHGLLGYRIYREYPDFSNRLKYFSVHANGRYSRMSSDDVHTTETPIHTVTTELIPLPSSINIMEHHANYIICLFGAIYPGSTLPEVRDFSISKTRRNRLFQEYVMCETLGQNLLQEVPNMTSEQEDLFPQIFKELRIQYQHELTPLMDGDPHEETSTKITIPKVSITDSEKNLLARLIFPRMKILRYALLGSDNINLSSMPYYDGNQVISVTASKKHVDAIRDHVIQSYLSFPEKFESYYAEKSPPTSDGPKR